MSGYDGFSMSNNAVAAYDSGERPLSEWTKADILSSIRPMIEDAAVMDMIEKLSLSVLKEKVLYRSSWHHTSSHYNRTDFYYPDEWLLSELTVEDVAAWAAAPKIEKKESIRYAGTLSYTEWVGQYRNYKRPVKRTLTGIIEERGCFYYVYDGDGNLLLKKKIDANGVEVTRA